MIRERERQREREKKKEREREGYPFSSLCCGGDVSSAVSDNLLGRICLTGMREEPPFFPSLL